LPGLLKQQEKNLQDLKWTPAGFFILGSTVMAVAKREKRSRMPLLHNSY
jgi:hypothetical protein